MQRIFGYDLRPSHTLVAIYGSVLRNDPDDAQDPYAVLRIKLE